ncbi:hypothetical protein MCC01993_11340 [Bifidobacteriaceae bacterium MCC01993]|nr:hypothetical protein MCC01993_11340 [Bifidobacteriaceae bacterium MCC01993]
MSFGKKIIAGVAAVATLAALAPAVAMADTAQNQNSATSSQAKEEYATVTFYTADGHSIQGVTWQKGTAFSQYALGIQAPTIEGKTFTGWAYSEGTMLKDTDQVFADIAVYATYADTPTQDDNTQYTVSFYAGADQLIQTVSYYAKDKVKVLPVRTRHPGTGRRRQDLHRLGLRLQRRRRRSRPGRRSDRQLGSVRHVQGRSDRRLQEG